MTHEETITVHLESHLSCTTCDVRCICFQRYIQPSTFTVKKDRLDPFPNVCHSVFSPVFTTWEVINNHNGDGSEIELMARIELCYEIYKIEDISR